MLSTGELFSRFFSLPKKPNQRTFYGSLATGVITALAFGFIYSIYFAISSAAGFFNFNADPNQVYEEVSVLSQIINGLISVILILVSSVITAINARAAVRFFNSEDLDTIHIVTDSLQFGLSSRGLLIGVLFLISNSVATFGYLFLVVPGIILSMLAFMSLFLMVDKDLPYFESLKEGWKLLQGHLFAGSIFTFFALILFVIASIFTCGVLGILIYSVSLGIYGTLYASLIHKPIFEGSLTDRAVSLPPTE